MIDKEQVYLDALIHYGTKNQLIVAIEELSEAQKEICKFLRGKGSDEHLAEEIADAEIMLEQVKGIKNLSELVETYKRRKLRRLAERIADDCNG